MLPIAAALPVPTTQTLSESLIFSGKAGSNWNVDNFCCCNNASTKKRVNGKMTFRTLVLDIFGTDKI